MSRYGYIEEYKKLIDTLKLALTECWKIITTNDPETSNMEKLAAIGRSNETIARLQSIYQYLPQIMTSSSSEVPQEENDPVCNFEKCYHAFSIHGHRSHQRELNCVCRHPTNSVLGVGIRMSTEEEED